VLLAVMREGGAGGGGRTPISRVELQNLIMGMMVKGTQMEPMMLPT
jgi:hypothetical protein